MKLLLLSILALLLAACQPQPIEESEIVILTYTIQNVGGSKPQVKQVKFENVKSVYVQKGGKAVVIKHSDGSVSLLAAAYQIDSIVASKLKSGPADKFRRIQTIF